MFENFEFYNILNRQKHQKSKNFKPNPSDDKFEKNCKICHFYFPSKNHVSYFFLKRSKILSLVRLVREEEQKSETLKIRNGSNKIKN